MIKEPSLFNITNTRHDIQLLLFSIPGLIFKTFCLTRLFIKGAGSGRQPAPYKEQSSAINCRLPRVPRRDSASAVTLLRHHCHHRVLFLPGTVTTHSTKGDQGSLSTCSKTFKILWTFLNNENNERKTIFNSEFHTITFMLYH